MAQPFSTKAEQGPTALNPESYAWNGVVREWVSTPPVWLGATPVQQQIYLENWRQRWLVEQRLEGQGLEQLERDADAMVWLLNDAYDVEHQAYLMSEKGMKLMPLKIRSDGASTVMSYDERYTPYIEKTRLLPFIQLVSRSTPKLNVVEITTLTDWWRPETHSFHLRTREMTVTLQDVSMITALPIEGKPLCMSTNSKGSRQQMEALVDMSPPKPEAENGGKKDIVPAGAPFSWIATNFAHCLEDANDDVI
ncbi:serine/threonine-protein phosphatase 7 [Hordeum vulgare]|nr:serine/threonine-protein phosphatase 7 [Hordeum vulgare]